VAKWVRSNMELSNTLQHTATHCNTLQHVFVLRSRKDRVLFFTTHSFRLYTRTRRCLLYNTPNTTSNHTPTLENVGSVLHHTLFVFTTQHTPNTTCQHTPTSEIVWLSLQHALFVVYNTTHSFLLYTTLSNTTCNPTTPFEIGCLIFTTRSCFLYNTTHIFLLYCTISNTPYNHTPVFEIVCSTLQHTLFVCTAQHTIPFLQHT